jgi:alpha-galactosidase
MSSSCSSFVNVTLYFTIAVFDGKSTNIKRQYQVDMTLDNKVIKQLSENGFSYIKIDYNSSIGKGADGSESLGESLRQHLQEVVRYLHKLREKIPGIVIENCASGGMRLDPLMMKQCDLGSFSDAHASPEIPIIAANLHRLIHPSKSLVWAVLRPEESLQRINYSMAATFLGRACLSGGIDLLSKEQLSIVQAYTLMYRRVQHIIKNGSTKIIGPAVDNYRQAKGYQVVLRENSNQDEMLLVFHSFQLTEDEETIEIGSKGYNYLNSFISYDVDIHFNKQSMQIQFKKSWVGAVFYFQKIKK